MLFAVLLLPLLAALAHASHPHHLPLPRAHRQQLAQPHRRHHHALAAAAASTPPAPARERAAVARRASSAKVVVGDGLARQFTSANTAISSVFLLPADDATGDLQGSARIPNTWSFSIAFDRSTFVSPTSSFVSYSASLASGAALPSWLRFNAYGIYFYGVAPAAGGEWRVDLCGGRWEGGKDVCQAFAVLVDRKPQPGEVRSGSNATAAASASPTASSSSSAAPSATGAVVSLRTLNITAETDVAVAWDVGAVGGGSVLDRAGLANATVSVDTSAVGGLAWNATSRMFFGTVANTSVTSPTYPSLSASSAANASSSSSPPFLLPVILSSPALAGANLTNGTSPAASTALTLLLPLAVYPSLFTSAATAAVPSVNATAGAPFALDVVRNLDPAVHAGSDVGLAVAYAPEQAGAWLRFNRTEGVVQAYDAAAAAADGAEANSTDFVYGPGSALRTAPESRKRALGRAGQAVVPADLAYDAVEITLTATDSLTGAASHERTTVRIQPASAAAAGGGGGTGGGGGLSSKSRTILGAVLGSVLGALLVLLLLFLLCRRRRRRRTSPAAQRAREQQAERAREKQAAINSGEPWFDPDDDDDDDDDEAFDGEDVDLRDTHTVGGRPQQQQAYNPHISAPLPPPPALLAPTAKRSSSTTLSRFRDFFAGAPSAAAAAEPRDRRHMVSTHKASLSSSGRGGGSLGSRAAFGTGPPPTSPSPRPSADGSAASAATPSGGYWSAVDEEDLADPSPSPPPHAAAFPPEAYAPSPPPPGSAAFGAFGTPPSTHPGGAGGAADPDGRRSSVSTLDQTPPTPGRVGPGWGQRALFPFLRHDPAPVATAPAARPGHQTHHSLASWESASTYDWNHAGGGDGSPRLGAGASAQFSTEDKVSSAGGGGVGGGGSFPSHYSAGAGAGALRDEAETPPGGLPLSLTARSSSLELGPPVGLSLSSLELDPSDTDVIRTVERGAATQGVKVRVASIGSAAAPPSPNPAAEAAAAAATAAGAADAQLAPDVRTVRHSVPPASSVQQFAHPPALPFSPPQGASALAPVADGAEGEQEEKEAYMTYVRRLSGAPPPPPTTSRTPARDVHDFARDDGGDATEDDDGFAGAADDTFGSYDLPPPPSVLHSPLSSLVAGPSAAAAAAAAGKLHPAPGLTPPRPLAAHHHPSSSSSPASSGASGSPAASSPRLSFRTSDAGATLVYFAYVADRFAFRPVDDAAAAARGGTLRAVQTDAEGNGELPLPGWLAFERGVFEGVPGEEDEGRIELKITETGPSATDSALLEERTIGHFSLEVRPSPRGTRRSTRAGNPGARAARVVSSSGLIGQWHG